ncbi:hypothetical protein STEG23_025238 [Scotinomys teguina]
MPEEGAGFTGAEVAGSESYSVGAGNPTHLLCKRNNSTFKSVRGIVTTLSTEYGWINESIFFNPDMVCGNVPVNVGMSVIVRKKMKHLTQSRPSEMFCGQQKVFCICGETECTGFEVFSVLIKVCVTSIGGTTGVVDDVIFFALESVQKPSGYTPRLYDIVNVVAVDSIQQQCSWRAVAMNPVEMCID